VIAAHFSFNEQDDASNYKDCHSTAMEIQTLSEDVSASKTIIEQELSNPLVESLSMNLSKYRKEIWTQKV
jgi:hypothetical protein